MKMSGIKRKKENIKGRREGNIMIISVLGFHNCRGRKSIVPLKDTKNPMA